MKKPVSAIIIFLLLSMAFNGFSQDSEKERQRERERAEADRARTAHSVAVLPSSKSASTGFASSYSTGDGVFYVNSSGSSSSQLSLSKSFEGESKKNEGAFEVDESVRIITLSLSGRVEEGEIKINIILPDGKKMKELTIDSSADIQFNQTLKISEDQKKYYGKWTYSVESVKAIGQYRMMINTR